MWDVDTNGHPTRAAYGPYSGLTAEAIAAGSDNHVHLLWDNSSGGIALWDIAPGAAPTGNAYSASTAFTALGLAAGPDNHVHVLWNHSPDKQMVLWDVAPGTAPTGATYGPYAGLTPTALAVGPNNHVNVLWDNPNGSEALWGHCAGRGSDRQCLWPRRRMDGPCHQRRTVAI